jgi:hypothetical protein
MLAAVTVGLCLGFTGPAKAGYVFTTLDVPGATAGTTAADGINNVGQIVGLFADTIGTPGFLLSGGKYTTLDVPGAFYTQPNGINDAGQIVGFFFEGGFSNHGFLLSGGRYTAEQVGEGSSADQLHGVAGPAVPDLVSVRDHPALDRLAEAERAAWRALWRDVDDLAKRLAKKDEPTKERKGPESTKTKPEGRSSPAAGAAGR